MGFTAEAYLISSVGDATKFASCSTFFRVLLTFFVTAGTKIVNFLVYRLSGDFWEFLTG